MKKKILITSAVLAFIFSLGFCEQLHLKNNRLGIKESSHSPKSLYLNFINCKDFPKLDSLLESQIIQFDSYFDNKWNPFFIACKCGYTEIVKNALKDESFVKIKNQHGESGLMFAVENNQVEVANILLKNGANVNEKDNKNLSVLMKSAPNGNNKLIRMLIDFGAKIHVKKNNVYVENSVQIAIRNCNTQGFLALKDGLIIQNQKEELRKNERFIFSAVGVGCLPILKELIEYQSPSVIDFEQKTLIEVAVEFAILHDFYIRSGYINHNDSSFIFKGDLNLDLKLINFLIDFGVDIHVLNSKGETLLFQCSESPLLMDYFLKKGVDPNLVNLSGETVLMKTLSELFINHTIIIGDQISIHEDNIEIKNMLKVVESLLENRAIVDKHNFQWKDTIMVMVDTAKNSSLTEKLNYMFQTYNLDFRF